MTVIWIHSANFKTRLICNVGCNAHTNKLFHSCNTLKIKHEHKFKLAVYKYELNSSSTADYQNNHNYNTLYRDNLIPYFPRSSVTQHSIPHNGPRILNELPCNIKTSQTLKRKVKYNFVYQYSSL